MPGYVVTVLLFMCGGGGGGGGGGVLMFVIPNRRHGHLFEILRYMQVPPYYAI